MRVKTSTDKLSIEEPQNSLLASQPAPSLDLIYVVYREGLSSVFHSQVLTPLRLQAEHVRVRLVVLTPVGQMLRKRWRAKLNGLKRQVAEMPGLSLHLLPSPPTRLPWLWRDRAVLQNWMRKHCGEDGRPLIVQARNPQAFSLARDACQGMSQARLIFDCRGASPYEYLQQQGAAEDKPDEWPPAVRREFNKIDQLERDAALHADHVCCVSQAMVDYLRDRTNLPAEQFSVVPCCPDVEAFSQWANRREQIRAEEGWSDRYLVAYCGSMAWYQWPEQAVRVFQLIRRIRADAHFLALTTQPNQMRDVLRKLELDTPELATVRQVPPTEVPRLLACADVGLLLRDRTTVNRVAAPVKFGEYLASGTPVIISEGLGDYSEMVRRYGLGMVVDPDLTTEVLIAELSSRLGDCEALAKQSFDHYVKDVLMWRSRIKDRLALLTNLINGCGADIG